MNTFYALFKRRSKQTNIALVAFTLLLAVVFVVGQPAQRLLADTESELRNKTDTLENKISANEGRLEDLEVESTTLKGRIEGLKTEITIANDKINLISNKIAQIKLEVSTAEKELARQNDLLKASLRALYKQGEVTTIELLASSDGYKDYINQQEYLERLKKGIQDSVDKVEELKQQLEDQQVEQEDLLTSQQNQRTILATKKQEQADLLRKTQGQESKYKTIIAGLEEQRRQAEDELKSYLASLIKTNYTSLGYVTAGTAIGLVGSSGFSTGPHLHFAVTDGSSFYNPSAGNGSLSYGYQWPLPNSSWDNVSQGYGCVAPASWYITKCNGGQNSFHSGLDISGWYGDPVTAAADGDIVFRGWLGGYGNTVIIDHGTGLFTYYPHMLE